MAEQGELGETRRELLRGANPEILRVAGPLIYPDMRAELRPEVPLPEWAHANDYALYQDLTDHSVTFRGIQFQAGDLIIVDEARPVAGFMPSLFAPRQMMNHFAFFTIANFEGRYIPIVYDLADTFRIIPLNLFLSERFCTNAFVLRHKEMTIEKARRAERAAYDIFQFRPPFNMEAEEGKDISEGLTCGTFALNLLGKLGLSLPTERSIATNPRLIANLEKVKYSRRQIFSPINMFQSEKVDLVGAIDNGQLGKVIVRSFVNRRYADLMHTKDLDVYSFAKDFDRLVYAVGRMQERSMLGTVFRAIFAYEHTAHTFARGNPYTIALYHQWHTALAEAENNAFISLCPRALLGAAQPPLLSIHDFENSDGGLQASLSENLKDVAKHFR